MQSIYLKVCERYGIYIMRKQGTFLRISDNIDYDR